MRSLEKGSHLAQIISAFAVVVSILYLAGQVRDNTTAVNVATSQGLLELGFQKDARFQDSAQVALLLRGDSLPEMLSPVEWDGYSRYQVGAFNIWEHAFFSSRLGTLDPDLWSGWDRSFTGDVCKPGVQRFWNETSGWYSDSFQLHVSEKVAACSQ
jgi:hypothetical protein